MKTEQEEREHCEAVARKLGFDGLSIEWVRNLLLHERAAAREEVLVEVQGYAVARNQASRGHYASVQAYGDIREFCARLIQESRHG